MGRKKGTTDQYQGQRRASDGQDSLTELMFDLGQRKKDLTSQAYGNAHPPVGAEYIDPADWLFTGTRWIRTSELHGLSGPVEIRGNASIPSPPEKASAGS